MTPSASEVPRSSGSDYFAGDATAKATGLLQVLSPEGVYDGADVRYPVEKDLALSMYEGMVRIRIMDARLLALQRQGRIGFYGEARGQEAAVVGSAAALEKDDWVLPALREAGVAIYRGLSLDQYIAQIFGNAHDNSRGRQMPCHPCGRDVNHVVMSSVVSTQIPHAVGVAMAMNVRGDRGKVAIGYMGDGGTSEGEFHVALNFAGVFNAPVILFCQNNQWAISTPGDIQTAAETIALKGQGYGVEALRVDGNDMLAVYQATRYAAEKARHGGGPTFIEALTYRVSAHSSSDDPSRYRDETVTDEWKEKRDPLVRVRKWLMASGYLDEQSDRGLGERIESEVRAAVSRQEQVGMPPVDSLVEDVFEEVPWHLREQLEELQRSRNG